MFFITPAGSRRAVAGLFFAIVLLLLSGCARLGQGRPPALAGTPERASVAGVAFFPQEEFQCGPAALAMVLSWSGMEVRPEELGPRVYTPGRHGSLQTALISGARRHGRLAYPFSGSETLLAEIAAGRPALVLLNLGFSWLPRWHYAVAVGYDRPQGQIVLHSGAKPYEHLSWRTFSHLWQRSGQWGLLVLPPDLMPVRAEEQPWLEAAIGLERVGAQAAAAAAYAQGTRRWPQSFGFWLGLGNSRFAAGDPAGAVEAFRKAVRLRPKAGAAYNNLGQALAEMGAYEEAMMAVRTAVTLGGPLQGKFRQTLSEIEKEKRRAGE